MPASMSGTTGADRDIHEGVRIVAEDLVAVWSKFKGIEKSQGPVFVLLQPPADNNAAP